MLYNLMGIYKRYLHLSAQTLYCQAGAAILVYDDVRLIRIIRATRVRLIIRLIEIDWRYQDECHTIAIQ